MCIQHVPNARKIVLVLAAISNAFFPPLSVDNDIKKDYSTRILKGLKQNINTIEPICNSKGWNSVEKGRNKQTTTQFIKNTNIIPNYDSQDIINAGMGKHGWVRSSRYIAHGFKKCEAMTRSQDNKNCIKFKNIVGRFASTKTKTPRKYTVCIDFGNNKNTKLKNIKYYCTCKTGRRTCNPCAHTIAVLRYILLEKNNEMNNIRSNFYSLLSSTISDCHKYVQFREQSGKHCICEKNDNRWTIECELCKEKYHPACINTTKAKLQKFIDNNESWWCPMCEEDNSETDDEYDNDSELTDNDIDSNDIIPSINDQIEPNNNLNNENNEEIDDIDVVSFLNDDDQPKPKRRKLNNGNRVATGITRSSKGNSNASNCKTVNKRRRPR